MSGLQIMKNMSIQSDGESLSEGNRTVINLKDATYVYGRDATYVYG